MNQYNEVPYIKNIFAPGQAYITCVKSLLDSIS